MDYAGGADELIEQVDARLGDLGGTVDILVNCAGSNPRPRLEEIDPELYREILAVNLDAPFALDTPMTAGLLADPDRADYFRDARRTVGLRGRRGVPGGGGLAVRDGPEPLRRRWPVDHLIRRQRS